MQRDQALKFTTDLLRRVKERNGSDLFIAPDFPPAIKIDGALQPQSNQPLTAAHTLAIARAVMNDRQAAEFEATKECNFAISPANIGRFRVNAYRAKGGFRSSFAPSPTPSRRSTVFGSPPSSKRWRWSNGGS